MQNEYKVPLFELFDSPDVGMCSNIDQIPPEHLLPSIKGQ